MNEPSTDKFTFNKRLLFDTLAKYTDTFAAFCELLTNAVQARAKKIEIQIDYTPATELAPVSIQKIIILDHGHGVPRNEFGWKILQVATRAKEGGKGIGRFAALQLAAQMDIETVAYDPITQKFTKCELHCNTNQWNADSLDQIKPETKYTTLDGDHTPYYKVTLTDFYGPEVTKKEKHRRVSVNLLSPQIYTAIFAAYPEQVVSSAVQFLVNGKPIKSEDFLIGEVKKKSHEFVALDGKRYPLDFQFFQVTSQGKQRVFLRTTNNDIKTVAYTFDYSFDCPEPNQWFILIDSPYFDENTDIFRNLSVAEIEPLAKHLVSELKKNIDAFFSLHYVRYLDFKQKLRADTSYPYKNKAATSETRSAVFDQLAYYLEEKHHLLGTKAPLRELVYNLMDKAIDSREFEYVLSKVLKLDERSLGRFQTLLDSADLDNVIAFTEEVARKQDILTFIHNLNYGPIAKHVKERKQLHKIVERHLWLFGEQYHGKPRLFSDKSLENTLKVLRDEVFAFEPSKEYENTKDDLDEVGKDITDLFFFNENIVDSANREIMVVELKAPKVRLSPKELEQARTYAYHIENRGVFPKHLSYKVILVGAEITRRAKSQCGREGNPYLFHKPDTGLNIECWAVEWSDLIARCRSKLTFLGNALNTKDKDTKEIIDTQFKDVNLSELKSTLTSSAADVKPSRRKGKGKIPKAPKTKTA